MCKGSNNILYMHIPWVLFYNLLEPKEVITGVYICTYILSLYDMPKMAYCRCLITMEVLRPLMDYYMITQ